MVKVCYVCGVRGFSNALLYCSECSDASVHQYCLGITPGSIDDDFDWVCECCSVQMEPESCTCRKFGGIFSQRAFKSCNEHTGDLKMESRSEIDAFLDQPEPLCTLLPMQYHGSSTQEKSSSQSQKQESPMSLFMEHPDSIMRGLILLVSPSGEVFIHGGMTFCDYSHLSSVASHIVNTTTHSNYIDSDKAFKKLGTNMVKHETSPLGKTEEKNGEYDAEEIMKLHKRKFQTLDEIYARAHITTVTGHIDNAGDDCEGNIEDSVLHSNASSKLDGLKGKSKSRRHRKLVRNQIVTMLINAGWKVEYRPRKMGKMYKDAVYVNPQGKAHYSALVAYRALQQDVRKDKAKKGKVGGGSGDSNFCFRSIPKEVRSVLCRHDQRLNKKTQSKGKRNR